jgi:beta-ribofuranosylaminobenzene 5'-phosphate synthase
LLIVRAFPRLHIGLIDLGNATMRQNGGAGISIQGLQGLHTEVRVRGSASFRLEGLESLDSRMKADISSALSRLFKRIPPPPIALHITCTPPQHVGLGSKTALILALLKATCLASGENLENADLQRLSGRGGTSGVGINVFFQGGFLVDDGHPASESRQFLPSSYNRPSDVPHVVVSADVPNDWRFGLLLPETDQRYSGVSELDFFKNHTPIPNDEVRKTLALVYHGLASAVISQDLVAFGQAIAGLQRVGFKAREVQAQPCSSRLLMRRLQCEAEIPVGLSSLGPLLYAVIKEDDQAARRSVRDLALEHRARLLGWFQGRTGGYEVIEGSSHVTHREVAHWSPTPRTTEIDDLGRPS